VLGLASIALVLGVWKLVEPRLFRRTVIELARVDYLKRPVEIRDRPFGGPLVSLGEYLGHAFEEGESSPDYVKRIWGVDVGPEIEEPREDGY
jgi:hypothetical protein